jgi:hypothetical protein
VVEEAKNVAEKEGLTAAAAAEAVRDIGEKVKHVVAAAGSEVTKEGGSASEPERASHSE